MQLHKEVAISESNTSPLISSDKVIIKHDVYILTPEELLELMKKIAGEAFDAGHSLGVAETLFNYTDHISKESLNMEKDKETYINSLTIE